MDSFNMFNTVIRCNPWEHFESLQSTKRTRNWIELKPTKFKYDSPNEMRIYIPMCMCVNVHWDWNYANEIYENETCSFESFITHANVMAWTRSSAQISIIISSCIKFGPPFILRLKYNGDSDWIRQFTFQQISYKRQFISL